MADVAQLDVIIGAKISGLEQGLNKVQQYLAKTAVAANKLDSSLSKASTSIIKSTTNFTGLSRIIQDLPFGFIGIQNNITQLLPAAGALGLVISLVTSAITFAQVGTSAWTRGLTGAKSKVDEAADAIKKAKEDLDSFNDSLKSAEAGAISQGVSLQKYVEIARDSTRSLEERNFALDKANKILGEHGEKLTLVNINTAAATEEVNKFTQALIQQALAAKFADRIAELIVKQKDQLIDYNKALDEVNKARERVKIPGTEDVLKLYDKLKEAYRGQNTTANAYNETLAELKLRMQQMSDAAGQSVDLFADLGTKTKETGKNLKTVSSILDDLNKQFTFLNAIETNQGLDKAEEKIKAIESAIKSLIDIGQDPAGGLIQNLFGGISEQALPLAGRLIDEMNKKLKETPVEVPVEFKPIITLDFTSEAIKRAIDKGMIEITSALSGVSVPVNLEFQSTAELDEAAKKFEKLRDIGKELSDVFTTQLPDGFIKTSDSIDKAIKKAAAFTELQYELDAILRQMIEQTLVQFGEALGKAFATGDVEGLFTGIFNTLADGLKQFGQTLIKYGIELALAKKALAIASPALAIAAGIALTALGSFVESKIPRLAEGGIATRATLGIFGEAGPEAIMPLDKLKDFVNTGSSSPVIMDVRIRGNDLVLFQRSAQRSYNRKY